MYYLKFNNKGTSDENDEKDNLSQFVDWFNFFSRKESKRRKMEKQIIRIKKIYQLKFFLKGIKNIIKMFENKNSSKTEKII